MAQLLREMHTVSHEETTEDAVRQLKSSLQVSEQKARKLEMEKRSPYKSFFYSSPDKQSYVQSKMDELNIPYRETENGFEAQECYVDMIRRLEKEYKAPQTNARSTLRDTIDRLLMQSDSFNELLERLQKEHYTIKRGKYISVKPESGDRFIRLKSLGEQYSEYALKNRIIAKHEYEKRLASKLEEAKQQKAPNAVVLRTMQFYTVSFAKDVLPMRKKDQKKPFAWTNDTELDRLLMLNTKINSGITLDMLRQDFETSEQVAAQKEAALDEAERLLKTYYELKEKIEIVYEGKHSDVFTLQEATQTLKQYPTINQFNFRNIDQLITKGTTEVQQASEEYEKAQTQLRNADELLTMAEKVKAGTYVQSLVAEERLRRESQFIPNGIRNATS